MIRVEAMATIRAAQPTVSEVYADYSNWPHVFPTINGVRVISGDGPELLLEVDHAEGEVRNELLIRSPGVIELWEGKRRYTAHFVNRFEALPGGTRYSVSAEIALKGTARLLQPLLHGHIRRQIKRWLLQPVKAVAEQRAGTSASSPASPPGLDANRSRAGTIAAYGAATLALGYAAVSLYWAAGGTALLATVGGTIEDLARRGGLPAVALGLAATVLKVAGGMLALALARPWGRAIPRRWLLRTAGIASTGLICYGALQVAAGTLVLSGALRPAGAVDHTALRWHVAVWDMWFLVWGLLLAGATAAHWRQGRGRLQ